MQIHKWRVYYPGHVSEADTPPARNVQAILQRDEQGDWHIRSGGDFYVLRGDVWTEVDLFGLFDYLLDSGIVLFGRTVSNKEFEEVMRKAMQDLKELDG